jgi:uncharacterized membrane protein YuzA (DUF378 family)
MTLMFTKIFGVIIGILAVWFLLMLIIKAFGFMLHWAIVIGIAVGICWLVKKFFFSSSDDKTQ